MRSCIICSHAAKVTKTRELICRRLSDQKVADALNKKWPQHQLSFMAVHRHRKQHMQKELQNEMAMINKDADARDRRTAIVEAASADTPSTQALVEATLGLRRQMEKLDNIEQRLERMAGLAEQAGSAAGVAQLAAQQFRGVETGAKLAGLTGFAPPAHATVQPGAAPVFSVNIIFSNGRREEINVIENRLGIEQEIEDRGEANKVDDDVTANDTTRPDPGAVD
jgi:hypothetical protein